eukprot:g4104.t1
MPAFALVIVSCALPLAAGATIFVDSRAPAASPCAGSTAASPCRGLKQACEGAAASDTVQVAAGSSFGASSCGISVTKSLTVTVLGGPAGPPPVIDCGGNNPAFVVPGTAPDLTLLRIYGVAMQNADQAIQVSATGFMLDVENSVFSGCRTAALGAAVSLGGSGYFRLVGNTFVNNSAVQGGGAVYVNDFQFIKGYPLRITGNNFTRNSAGTSTATAYGGGALYIRLQVTYAGLVVQGNIFHANSLVQAAVSRANSNGHAGGAILVFQFQNTLLGQLFEFADNVFTSNSVHYTSGPGTYGGGAVEVALNNLGYGGGMRGEHHIFRNNTFEGNRVSSTGFAHGGALAWRVESARPSQLPALQDVNISLIGNHFVRNEVVGNAGSGAEGVRGGGVSITVNMPSRDVSLALESNVFEGNTLTNTLASVDAQGGVFGGGAALLFAASFPCQAAVCPTTEALRVRSTRDTFVSNIVAAGDGVQVAGAMLGSGNFSIAGASIHMGNSFSTEVEVSTASYLTYGNGAVLHCDAGRIVELAYGYNLGCPTLSGTVASSSASRDVGLKMAASGGLIVSSRHTRAEIVALAEQTQRQHRQC